MDAGARLIRSPDGTAIADFESGGGPGNSLAGAGSGARSAAGASHPPVVLVHGTSADHTAWRTLAPLLGTDRRLHAIDRRGRGASGDGPSTAGDQAGYAIEREYEDVAAVASAVAAEHGGPVDVLGHSYGGRVALGAALLTPDIRRVVCYEGAPRHVRRGRLDGRLAARLAPLADVGRDEELLDAFLAAVAEMGPADLAAYHANPVWPSRVEAARRTLLRELRAEPTEAAGLTRLGRVRQPVLLILGSRTPAFFREGVERLVPRLAHPTVAVVDGARHAAHHTHAPAFAAVVRSFLDA